MSPLFDGWMKYKFFSLMSKIIILDQTQKVVNPNKLVKNVKNQQLTDWTPPLSSYSFHILSSLTPIVKPYELDG